MVTFGRLGTSAVDAKTFSWPHYLTVYSGASKVAVAHGGVHGVNADGDLYISAYVRDPNGGGRPAYAQLHHQAVGTGGYGTRFEFSTTGAPDKCFERSEDWRNQP